MVIYKTNVDCVKGIVSNFRCRNFSERTGDIIPSVGDDICIVDEPQKRVLLEVCKRTFFKDRVEIEANLTRTWAARGIIEFEKFVTGR